MGFNVVILKGKIRELQDKTHEDVRVLMVVDSFWGCSTSFVKGKLAGRIAKYAGCRAWKIAMDYTYTEH